MRMFPPKHRNTAESMPNSGGPINAKETYLKIHTHTHTLTPAKQAAYQRLGEKDQSSNSKDSAEKYDA